MADWGGKNSIDKESLEGNPWMFSASWDLLFLLLFFSYKVAVLMEPHGYWFNMFVLYKRRLNLDKVYFLRGANIFEVAPLSF